VWAQVELAQRRPVAVAVRDLASGEVVESGDLEVQLLDAEAHMASPSQVVGGCVLRGVEAGSIVGIKDVAAPPPVGRGTDVLVRVKVGAVVVESAGKLEDAARPGERTRVRVATGRVIKGQLVDRETVEVVGGPR
jgi:flagella basal body P-ring formation protein FlgA